MVAGSCVKQKAIRGLITALLLLPLGIVMAARWSQDGSGTLPFAVAALGLVVLCSRVFRHQGTSPGIALKKPASFNRGCKWFSLEPCRHWGWLHGALPCGLRWRIWFGD